MISFHREGPTLPGRSSRLADHPHIKGYALPVSSSVSDGLHRIRVARPTGYPPGITTVRLLHESLLAPRERMFVHHVAV